MPSVASVNYTSMQGDAGREMQNIRSFTQDTAQPVVANEQQKKNEEKKVTVQDSGGSGGIKFKKDKEKEKQDKKKKRQQNKKGSEAARASGRDVLRSKRKRLLDIVV